MTTMQRPIPLHCPCKARIGTRVGDYIYVQTIRKGFVRTSTDAEIKCHSCGLEQLASLTPSSKEG